MKKTTTTKTATKTAKTAAPIAAPVALSLDTLVKGTAYDKAALAPLFVRNDSNINSIAGNLDVERDKRIILPLYKAGTFAGTRHWFTPTVNGYMYLGTTEKIGEYWYSSANGTAHKTRDNVLREAARAYVLS